MSLDISQEFLRRKYEEENLSALAIARDYGCSKTTIYRYLRANGIKIKTPQEIHPDLFTDNQEVMNGLLLGDGHIMGTTDGNARLCISQTNLGLVAYLRTLLCPRANICTIKKKSYFTKNGILINAADSHRIMVQSVQLNNYRYLWYPNEKKVVPKNINLTPLTVLNWFYGDGSTTRAKNKPNLVALSLYTNGFNEEDVRRLQILLSQVLNCPINVNKARNGFAIKIWKKDSVRNFFGYIGPCTVPSMEYKWKYPI